jgi:aspartokinase
MKVNTKCEAVTVVYTSLAGTKIFAHKDITQISAFRGVAAEKNKRFASLCLTEDELKHLINTALDGINKKQDFAQAISILHELKFRSEMICEENSLLELAYIYLMIEGEDLEKPTQEFNKHKAALVEAELDIKRFFLQRALQLVGHFSQKPGVDLLNYLEETRSLMLKLSRFIQYRS